MAKAREQRIKGKMRGNCANGKEGFCTQGNKIKYKEKGKANIHTLLDGNYKINIDWRKQDIGRNKQFWLRFAIDWTGLVAHSVSCSRPL